MFVQSEFLFYLNCMLTVSGSLGPHGLQPARLLCPWDFPGKSTGGPPGGPPHPGTEPEVPAAPELVGAFFTYQFFLTAPPEIILYMPSLEKLKNF